MLGSESVLRFLLKASHNLNAYELEFELSFSVAITKKMKLFRK